MGWATERALDLATDSKRTQEINPLNEKFYNVSLLDTTNLAADTYYYPSSSGFCFDGYKSLSITGQLTDADNTLALTVWAMNDEDTSGGDWIQIYGYDSKNDAMVNSISISSSSATYAVDFDNLNYRYFRIKLVAGGATNTVIIKCRMVSL